jgi:DNA helicase-2/ATP-dependent DNA helicase PcrA
MEFSQSLESGRPRSQFSGSSFTPPPVDDSVSELPYLRDLNEKQREAVLITEGPLMVIAGAGSGKTKMLTTRIAHLIESGRASPHQILAVTFTNKAAAEMRARVERTLGLASQAYALRWERPWDLGPEPGVGYLGTPEIGTFHSFCVRLLRREMAFTPFTKPFVIYDDSDQLSLVKSIMKQLQIDEKAVNPKAVQGYINSAKCDAHEPDDLTPSPHDFFGRKAKQVYEIYQKALFQANALDFGEIITLPYKLLRDRLELRQKYQRRYRYLHVDEYQDTNRAQYLLLSMLAGASTGGHQNLCVVGDEDQSIYKWRGADIRNILDFEHDFPGAQMVKLEQNYRSTQTIIEAASHLIRNNTQRREKTLWTDNQRGLPIVRAIVPDERAEAEYVIGEIKRLAQNEGRAYSDFSIFYRTNAQSRQFEDVFRREKVPYQIVGGLRFYDRKEIKDVLSYLKVILNPEDSVSLKRIINVPARGIGKTTLDRIDNVQLQEKLTTWQALERVAGDPLLTSPATAKKVAGFVALLTRLMSDQPRLLLTELYHRILDATGYVRELRKEGTDEALARIENLEELDSLLQEFEEDQFSDLGGIDQASDEQKSERAPALLPIFLEQSALASDVDSKDPHASAVRMMTLHSSKGLEFPVVFMVGMEEGLFPSIKVWEEENAEDIEEERRLCYVGITRAREALYLISVKMRRLWGNINTPDASRFFLEIPDDLMEVRDLTLRSGGFRPGSSRFHQGSPSLRREELYFDDLPQEAERQKARKPPTSATGGLRDFSAQGLLAKQNKAATAPSNPMPTSGMLSSSATQKGRVSLEGGLVGRRFQHPEYGMGRILSTEGSGGDQRLVVEFDRSSPHAGDRRKFLRRYVETYILD